jgi:hypothetical protein
MGGQSGANGANDGPMGATNEGPMEANGRRRVKTGCGPMVGEGSAGRSWARAGDPPRWAVTATAVAARITSGHDRLANRPSGSVRWRRLCRSRASSVVEIDAAIQIPRDLAPQ